MKRSFPFTLFQALTSRMGWEKAREWFEGERGSGRVLAVGMGLIYLSLIPFILRAMEPVHGDVRLYFSVTRDLFAGVLPYRDRVFEYPPYSILWFLLPHLGGGLDWFQYLFAAEILALDMAVKVSLLLWGMEQLAGWKGLLPVVLYAVGADFLSFFYLQRLDLAPAAMTLWALWEWRQGRYLRCGLVLALGTGTKVYPVLLAVPVGLGAIRQRRWFRFATGFALGVLPLGLLSSWVPWWRFAFFHTGRGLEVESLYAAVLWWGHLVWGWNAKWVWVHAWEEVGGSLAAVVVPWAKLWFGLSVGLNTAWVGWRVWKKPPRDGAGMARAGLAVLLPFVIFNYVLSPQYQIWLLVPAAAGLRGRRDLALWGIALGAVVTPVFYPSPDFGSGLTLGHTSVLLLRDLLLIAVWLVLTVRPLGCSG